MNIWQAACGLALTALAAFAGVPAESAETVLYSFCAQQACVDGAMPIGALIADKTGNFYGTTYYGGKLARQCIGGYCGTVFKLAGDGTETVLHTFTGKDGGNSNAGLIADRAGNLYGTTEAGGKAGLGTVFKLAPDGTETVLHSFLGGKDGNFPNASLIMDRRGNLFGTTELGGGLSNCYDENEGCGTVFEVTRDGKEKVLYAFTGGSDGGNPVSSLIADKNRNFYGTTQSGGAACEGYANGCGVAFKLTPDGTETVLHAFTGGSDGINPLAGLIEDSAGNFFGTTFLGGVGCGAGCGIVFKLAPDGTETVLYAFKGGSDGSAPYSSLIEDKAGNLYGTTYSGGGRQCNTDYCGGTVFKLEPDGTETLLYAFASKHGAGPASSLLMDKRGVLYGTTADGAAHNHGAVFRIRQ
jgi:uncharacterized repeat protein (TIGR03803 family)